MEANKTETKEESKPTPPPPADELSILINKAKAHILAVKEQVIKYTGKVNHNPYIWLRDKGFTKAESMVNNPSAYSPTDIKIALSNILNMKAEPPIVMQPPILDRKELNDKIEQEKEDRKKKA